MDTPTGPWQAQACGAHGSLLRLDVMAARTLSVRLLRLTTATSTRLRTSGCVRASAGETS